MRGARRRPYVDMVKPGNDADGAPQGGAGAPMFFRGCDPAGARARVQVRRCGPLPGRTYACTRRHCSAVRVPWPQPEWDGAESNGPLPLLSALGQVDEAQAASACSGAHLFVGSPRNIDILLRALLLRPASHIASVAHVPIYETGSGHERYRSVIAALHSKHQP